MDRGDDGEHGRGGPDAEAERRREERTTAVETRVNAPRWQRQMTDREHGPSGAPSTREG